MSLEHSKQATRFPLVRGDSTDVEAVVAIVRYLSKAHSLSEIMETVTYAARTRSAGILSPHDRR